MKTKLPRKPETPLVPWSRVRPGPQPALVARDLQGVRGHNLCPQPWPGLCGSSLPLTLLLPPSQAPGDRGSGLPCAHVFSRCVHTWVLSGPRMLPVSACGPMHVVYTRRPHAQDVACIRGFRPRAPLCMCMLARARARCVSHGRAHALSFAHSHPLWVCGLLTATRGVRRGGSCARFTHGSLACKTVLCRHVRRAHTEHPLCRTVCMIRTCRASTYMASTRTTPYTEFTYPV